MPWPVDAQHTVFVSGTTRIGATFLNAIQSGITGIIGGKRTITRLDVDGLGAQAAGAVSGSIRAIGNVQATSGTLTAGGDIQTSGGTVYARHFVGTAAASIDFNSGAGSGSPSSGTVVTDTGGCIAFAPRQPNANSTVATVTFAKAYPSGRPVSVVISPANGQSASILSGGGAWAQIVVKNVATTGFDIYCDGGNALASGVPYAWRYVVMG